ncbi:hypothetical protein SAY86_005298 [Trapa natans]|uniref:Jacalin-type lectin domain-containing protein n=1 Tax=Trapa natans TaxID=22666 RepID=A0AAN7L0S4_TRANT|nr:hypothetical protein SAY86_005298 [Trapa natans]
MIIVYYCRVSIYDWQTLSHVSNDRPPMSFDTCSGQIIHSISCTYDDNGDAVEGSKHGGGGPVKKDILDIWGITCIRSLTFKTNKKRTFGPFGSERGTPFFIESSTCKIVGLFGSNSIYLHSIRSHMEILPDNQQMD